MSAAIPHMSMYRRGSNQHQMRHRRNLKPGTWLSILLIALFFALPVYLCYLNGQMEKKFQMLDRAVSKRVYAAEYHEPEMADVSEREANIAIIKKIWTNDWKIGVAIASCESGLRASAVNRHNSNGSIDVGLFQINSIHGYSETEMLDPIANAGVAYAKYVKQGTSPWYSSETCWEERL